MKRIAVYISIIFLHAVSAENSLKATMIEDQPAGMQSGACSIVANVRDYVISGIQFPMTAISLGKNATIGLFCTFHSDSSPCASYEYRTVDEKNPSFPHQPAQESIFNIE
ncbi:MAG: hypothetical protein C4541_09305 [Candidatus Auribacter fodinae]|jgi:hypothetical protein|uniref:Uncharacterized protein n=1 Tax=Candidatus Auribacter fodinae TaxID=2093366 RepID=A0A3A4QVD6_9BACT|nr:MAG: hypothetical protein C4541_09305 [Candidatus Auribacter fodinae]